MEQRQQKLPSIRIIKQFGEFLDYEGRGEVYKYNNVLYFIGNDSMTAEIYKG